MTADVIRCGVCGIEDEPELLTYCFRCAIMFHLNPYSNRPGRDCGDAVLGEVELGVFYYCEPCLVILNDEAIAAERGNAPSQSPPLPPSVAAPPPPPPAPPGTRRRFRRVDS